MRAHRIPVSKENSGHQREREREGQGGREGGREREREKESQSIFFGGAGSELEECGAEGDGAKEGGGQEKKICIPVSKENSRA